MLIAKVWLGVTAVGMLALLLGACAGADITVRAPTAVPSPGSSPAPDTVVQEPKGPLLSDALIRDCEDNRESRGFEHVGLDEGATAVDFTLTDTVGTTFSLSELLGEKPVVMVFGSFT